MNRPRLAHAGLIGLELRRTLAPRGLCAFLLFLIWLAYAQQRGPIEVGQLGGEALSPERSAELTRGLARQGIWGGALLLLLPALVLRSAASVTRLRRGDADWVGARPVSSMSWVLSTWIGLSVAGWLALGAVAAAAEWGRGSAPTMAFSGSLATGQARVVAGGETCHWRLPLSAEATPPGSRLRMVLLRGFGPGGPVSSVTLQARRDGQTGPAAQTLVHGRSHVEVALPEGSGALELKLSNQGEGAVTLLADPGFEFWRPAPSDRRASLEAFLRAALALSAALALGLGFGAWVSPATAGLGVLALWVGVHSALGAVAWLPGLRLPRALGFIGQGRLPESFDARGLVGLGLCLAAGVCLALPGLRSWRHGR